MLDKENSKQDKYIKLACRAMSYIKFYPVAEKLDIINSHMEDENVRKVLYGDFNKYTMACFKRPFRPGQFPADFEDKERLSKYSGRLAEMGVTPRAIRTV
jgi:hypothetical protein